MKHFMMRDFFLRELRASVVNIFSQWTHKNRIFETNFGSSLAVC
jgi:hypothetical protein